jgi:hypothetical protein
MPPILAADLRDAGAMNSGPTGSLTDSRRIRSISDLARHQAASRLPPRLAPVGWDGARPKAR